MIARRHGATTQNTCFALATALLICACDTSSSADEAEPASEPVTRLSVYTGNYPLKYFAQRIGGERVTAVLPAPAGKDPATWYPEPEVVLAYQRADLILLNGAEYEPWVVGATLPSSRVVDTSESFKDEIIHIADAITHSHGREGEHSHGETASTTWLDLTLAARQAKAVRDALIAAEPESRERFERGFASLRADLAEIDGGLRAIAAQARDAVLLGATPVYQYLTRYGLDVRSLRFDAADPHGSDFWHDVQHAVADSRMMLWPWAPPEQVQERLDGLSIRVILFDPAGGTPSQGDLLAVLRSNVSALEAALGEARTRPGSPS